MSIRVAGRGSRPGVARLALAGLIAAAVFVGVQAAPATPVFANHEVFVEGEVDWDGDGRVGVEEDRDGVDRVFGTINAALGNVDLNVPGGPDINASRANQNGAVVIVTSGRFPETVVIGQPVMGLPGGAAMPGVVILEAAPGVSADIDAFVQGVAGGPDRMAAPGIVVNMPANRYAVIRNVSVRNWTDGIRVIGDSRLLIENGRLDSNVEYGINVSDRARVTISNTAVVASGIRVNPTAISNAPNPGGGIIFRDSSSGVIADSIVSGSVAAGIANMTANPGAVQLKGTVVVFDNNPDYVGLDPRGYE